MPSELETLTEQYELPDSSFDPELDGIQVPGTPAVTPTDQTPPAANTEPAGPPKGKGGQFLSPRLVARAKALGIDADEIANSTAAELREAVNDITVERLLSQQISAVGNSNQPAPVAPAQAATPAPAQPAPQADDFAFDWGTSDDGAKLTAEDHAPWAQNLVKLVSEQARTIKELREQVGQHGQYVQGQIQRTLSQEADAYFAEHPDVFGEGTVDLIDKNSIEFERRKLVIGRLGQITDGSFRDRLSKAGSIFVPAGAPAAKPVRQDEPQPNGHGPANRMTRQRWDAGTLGPTTQRKGAPEPKGTRAAERAVAAKLNSIGQVNGDGFSGDEEFGLPE